MPMLDPKITRGGVVRSQIVRDQIIRQEAIFLQQLAYRFQHGTLVPFRLDQDVEDLALGIDGAPKIDHAAVDFQIDFVQMPDCVELRSGIAQVQSSARNGSTQRRTVS